MSATGASLTAFFDPQGVAIIGASARAGKLGYSVVQNLIRFGYAGYIYPVNPGVEEILGLRCYATILDVPDPVDLAVIIVPAPTVPGVLRACAQRGIRAANILSGGFAETDEAGRSLQAEIVAIAHRHDMRLVGPNCVGTLSTETNLNATFLEQMPAPGPIAFISQSGAMGGAIIDWAKGDGLGFSHFASLGNAADVSEADLIEYLAQDPAVGVFALYIEGIEDGRRFMAVTRQVSREKPVIALKAGGTAAGARAVASHTAHLAGSDAAYTAAFRQSGVIPAQTASDLFGAAMGLAYQPPPKGNRIAIITNAGGPGAVAADAILRRGLSAPEPGGATHEALRAVLGPAVQLANPIDMLGAASTREFGLATQTLLTAGDYDAVLAVLVPNAVNDPVGIADALAAAQVGQTMPIYACYMGGVSIDEGRRRLHHHRIPPYLFPESAAAALAAAYHWGQWRQTPDLPLSQPHTLSSTVSEAVHARLQEGQRTLGEHDLQQILAPLALPFACGHLAQSSEEAAAHARSLAAPVALKIVSPDLVHKTEAGGVLLNVAPEDVVSSYDALLRRVQAAQPSPRVTGVLVQAMAAPGREVIIGMRREPGFGPLLMFGGGGIDVEALRDVSFRLAPMTRAMIETMVDETATGRLLRGWRGQPAADFEALATLIEQVVTLVTSVPELVEVEFNPVRVHAQGQGVTILDARAVIGPA